MAAGWWSVLGFALVAFTWSKLRGRELPLTRRLNYVAILFVVLAVLEGTWMSHILNASTPELAPLVWPLTLTIVALLLPLAYVVTAWFQHRDAQRFERIIFEPVAEYDLPSTTRCHFERYTAKLEATGFRLLCDYRLKRAEHFYNRVLLSDDGMTFAELSTQRISLLKTIKACAFVTVFEGGHYLETSTLATTPRETELFHARSVPWRWLADVLVAHYRSVRELCERTHTKAIVCVPEDYPTVATYGQRLLGDALVREGLMATNIYADAPALRVDADSLTGALV
jgi:hypothetical protein